MIWWMLSRLSLKWFAEIHIFCARQASNTINDVVWKRCDETKCVCWIQFVTNHSFGSTIRTTGFSIKQFQHSTLNPKMFAKMLLSVWIAIFKLQSHCYCNSENFPIHFIYTMPFTMSPLVTSEVKWWLQLTKLPQHHIYMKIVFAFGV